MANPKKRKAPTGTTTVAAVFPDGEAAERAIRELISAGLAGDQIGVAMRDRDAQGQLVEATGAKATQGAVTGAVSGGVLGGIAGLLVGAGALVIPGIGPVLAGGALASALGAAGATAVAGASVGATAGGIVGALIGVGVPEDQARHLEDNLRTGGVIVTVYDAEGGRTREILERNGGLTGANASATTGTAGAPRRGA